jgi:hypothetical protein
MGWRSDDLERLFVPFLQVGRLCLRRHRIEVLRHCGRGCSRSGPGLTRADITEWGNGFLGTSSRYIKVFFSVDSDVSSRRPRFCGVVVRTRVKELEVFGYPGECGGGAHEKRRSTLISSRLFRECAPLGHVSKRREGGGFGKRSHGLARVD